MILTASVGEDQRKQHWHYYILKGEMRCKKANHIKRTNEKAQL